MRRRWKREKKEREKKNEFSKFSPLSALELKNKRLKQIKDAILTLKMINRYLIKDTIYLKKFAQLPKKYLFLQLS